MILGDLSEPFVIDLLNLPSHLQKTLRSIATIGRGSASDVARLTGKARAVESAYLNQLCLFGLAKKERKGRKAIFSLGGHLNGNI